MTVLAVWALGFVLGLAFLPRMARFVYDGKGHDFPHSSVKSEAVGLALIGLVVWPVVFVVVGSQKLCRVVADLVFDDE